MDFTRPIKFLDYKEYDYVISIGNKCPTAMFLSELHVYKESFPFDYIPTTPKLILKYMQNQDEFYPLKKVVRTKDGVWFGHFNIDKQYVATIQTFKRRFDRLFDILEQKKKILFVYSAEADIYNEMNNRYNDNYNQLTKIVEYIIETYKYDNFKLLCIHTNKSFDDTNNIVNFRINVPDIYMSDDMSTHTQKITKQYRQILKQLLKLIFKL
jgi:hypothetical protein